MLRQFCKFSSRNCDSYPIFEGVISTPTPLPDDIEALKRLLVDRDALIAKLMTEIARLKRWQFGRSSERLDTTLAQLQLALDDLQSAPALDEASPATTPSLPAAESTQEPPEKRALPLRRVPRAFPVHLPRETIVHEPTSCNCPNCGGAMRKLGEDVSELLDMVPGYFKVIRHVRPKLSCGHCSRVIQQPAPPRPLARAMAAPGLLAQIIVAKYADHCPLYRQQGIYRRSGVELDRATLATWVGGVARLLEPLVDVLGRYVLAAEKVHADDTPVPVLDPGRGKTKTGRLWTYVRDDRPAASRDPPAVWYRYSPNRRGEHPQTHLRHFRGILQADAYAGFGPLYVDGQIVEAACWAHARRKFYDARLTKPSVCLQAIARIRTLYAVERDARDQELDADQVLALRQERAVPLLEEFRRWMNEQDVLPKSPTGAAIEYVRSRWDAFTRYTTAGILAIDNNPAENALRRVALGRKNWLFAGSDEGGRRAAIIYGVIESCKRSGVEPLAYLADVLRRVATMRLSELEKLLPDRWKPAPDTS